MNHMNYLEALRVLRRAGFTASESTKLYQLHRSYGTSELDQAPISNTHLEFARWLVQTGRLTDQIAQGDAASTPTLEEMSIYKAVVACLGLKRRQQPAS